MDPKRKWLWIGGGMVAVLLLCALAAGGWWLVRGRTGLPAVPPTLNSEQIATWAAATVAAQQTPGAPDTPIPGTAPAATSPPEPTLAASSPTALPPTALPPTAAASSTPQASPTPPCLAARFVKDVTVPDGTTFAPGQEFTKTWRLRNVGSCTWTTAYTVYFDRGDAMSGPADINLPHAVDPNETVDVSVALKAPATPGTYKGYWKLRTDDGRSFGIGADRSTAFWVAIKVVAPTPTPTPTPTPAPPTLPPPPLPVLDFYHEASSAEWVSGAGILPFDGPDNDPRGFVKPRPGALLEDGSRPEKVLEMHPEWVDDGVITGRYPAFTVIAGHHFQAQIGFLALSDGSCGAGDAIFQLNYREGGTLHPLGQWHETCDGALRTLDVDLSSLAGHRVEFVLAVMANGSSAQDWAVWVEPIVREP